jgi:hypothetical protein
MLRVAKARSLSRLRGASPYDRRGGHYPQLATVDARR